MTTRPRLRVPYRHGSDRQDACVRLRHGAGGFRPAVRDRVAAPSTAGAARLSPHRGGAEPPTIGQVLRRGEPSARLQRTQGRRGRGGSRWRERRRDRGAVRVLGGSARPRAGRHDHAPVVRGAIARRVRRSLTRVLHRPHSSDQKTCLSLPPGPLPYQGNNYHGDWHFAIFVAKFLPGETDGPRTTAEGL